MGYPVWNTPAGFLGKIAELEFYDFRFSASDPDQNNITYSLIAGRMPPGLQLTADGYTYGRPEDIFKVSGTPRAVSQDVDFKFTIRAAAEGNSRWITDRTFTITITGNKVPQILSNAVPLGTYLDGTRISLPLEAIDLDSSDELTWKLLSGQLPDGVTLSEQGIISGIIKPFINLPRGATTGWENSLWGEYGFDFATRSTSKNYSFTVEVTDGKTVDVKTFFIKVISYNSLTADATLITADDTFVTVDTTDKRRPLLITEDLGTYSTFKSDNFFAFKFNAIDLDNDIIKYSLLGDSPAAGFDSNDTNYDMGLYDKGTFTLIPGVSLNEDTGWLSGYLPPQIESQKNYTFGIQVYKRDYPTYITEVKLFTITVLGNLNLDVEWLTDSDLGIINTGEVSKLTVEAFAKSGKTLGYTLTSDSRLPQGLTLLSDGTISGRCTFQSFSLDQGNTTFDQVQRDRGFLPADTVFDRTFRFTVVARASDNSISSQKTFTVQLNSVTTEPYENVYLKCLPQRDARNKYSQIVNNTVVFPFDSLYRPNDPYWGRRPEIFMLSAYGLRASAASEYIEAMQSRHYNKPLRFGEYGTSIARDPNTNEIIYEVIWVDLIEETRAYKQGVKQGDPAAETNLITKIDGWRNPSFNENDPEGYLVRINDEFLMRRDLVNSLGRTYPPGLPEWMTSLQKDRTVPGFVTKAVLAYVKPGKGDEVLFNLQKLSVEARIPDIKDVPFVADRYVLDNNLTKSFDLEDRKFIEHRYTTFDLSPRIGQELDEAGTVDFALEIPFEYINGRTTAQINALGGLDGIITSYVGKTIIFAKQEQFIGYPTTSNNGWISYNQYYDDITNYDMENFDEYEVVPGYVENGSDPNIPNKRAGIWKINLDGNGLIELEFQQEVSINQVVNVRFGGKYGGNKVQYDPSTITELATVPSYKILDFGILPESKETTFDGANTKFVNNIDTYMLPYQNGSYLKFPKQTVFS